MRGAIAVVLLGAMLLTVRASGLEPGAWLRGATDAAEDRAVAASMRAAEQTAPLDTSEADTAAIIARGPSLTPSFQGRFADPAVLVANGKYYAYATRGPGMHIQVMTSDDLVRWSPPINALPLPPVWADALNPRTWAPSVVAAGGEYVMWYTVRDLASKRQCISVATARHPIGPFVDRSEAPAICQFDRGGSIDPDVFVDEGGAAYLVWKSDDNAVGRATHLWAAPLSAGATSAGSPVHLLTHAGAWQGPLIEGPAMVRADNRYYLFYGANNWASSAAGIGYATCASPLGPCEDVTPSGAWLASYGSALGPSGPQIFRDASGQLRMAYHAWYQCVGGPPPCGRLLYIGTLAFRGGRPILGS